MTQKRIWTFTLLAIALAVTLTTDSLVLGKGKPPKDPPPEPDPPPVSYALHRFSMPVDFGADGFGGTVSVEELNDVGELVGYYPDSTVEGGEQPFYLDINSDDTVATNLNDLEYDQDYGIPAGWHIGAATGINNLGDISAALENDNDPDQLRGCVIQLRPDSSDLTLLPRLNEIPEDPAWGHTYARRINDEGVVLGGDTDLHIAYVYHLGDEDVQIIPEPFHVWSHGYLTNPVGGGASLVKMTLGDEVLTYNVDSGTSTSESLDNALRGFNDYGDYCGSYAAKRNRKKGYWFDGVLHSLDDMSFASSLNNAGDVIGEDSGDRIILYHPDHGSISLDTTIVAENDAEQAIWDESKSLAPTLSERDVTGFPIVSGTMLRNDTSITFHYDGYILIPIPE